MELILPVPDELVDCNIVNNFKIGFTSIYTVYTIIRDNSGFK